MDIETIFFKTEKGKDEIEHRSCGLPFNQRRVLILVDGRSTVAQLRARSVGIPDLEEILEELQRQGLVHVAGAEAPDPAASADDGAPAPRNGSAAAGVRERLIGLAGEILGPDAGKVVRKLREAADSEEGLATCLESCRKVVKLTIDEAKAEELYRRGRELLH